MKNLPYIIFVFFIIILFSGGSAPVFPVELGQGYEVRASIFFKWQTDIDPAAAGDSELPEPGEQDASIVSCQPSNDGKANARRAIKSFDQTFTKVWPPAGPPEATGQSMCDMTLAAVRELRVNTRFTPTCNPGSFVGALSRFCIRPCPAFGPFFVLSDSLSRPGPPSRRFGYPAHRFNGN